MVIKRFMLFNDVVPLDMDVNLRNLRSTVSDVATPQARSRVQMVETLLLRPLPFFVHFAAIRSRWFIKDPRQS